MDWFVPATFSTGLDTAARSLPTPLVMGRSRGDYMVQRWLMTNWLLGAGGSGREQQPTDPLART
jgi:hypothetical protein